MFEHDGAKKLSVLFLCTGNSGRGQMAEGWTRALEGNIFVPLSAGTAPRGVDPLAVKVMHEVGVDISDQEPTHVSQLLEQPFAYVVTGCGHAHEKCPIFPGKTKVVHVGFDDPPELAEGAASEEEAMSHYRRIRNEIRSFVERLPHALKMEATL